MVEVVFAVFFVKNINMFNLTVALEAQIVHRQSKIDKKFLRWAVFVFGFVLFWSFLSESSSSLDVISLRR